jgi:hypothetical protein
MTRREALGVAVEPSGADVRAQVIDVAVVEARRHRLSTIDAPVADGIARPIPPGDCDCYQRHQEAEPDRDRHDRPGCTRRAMKSGGRRSPDAQDLRRAVSDAQPSPAGTSHRSAQGRDGEHAHRSSWS